MPGGGKSTIGKLLARRLGVSFADSDAVIEGKSGVSITELFHEIGEPAFRDRESAAVEALINEGTGVIATGGGFVLRLANRELLRRRTLAVYLDAAPAALWRRVQRHAKRPLLQVADPHAKLLSLHAERHPLYVETAALTVDSGGPPLHSVVDQIVEGLARLNATPATP